MNYQFEFENVEATCLAKLSKKGDKGFLFVEYKFYENGNNIVFDKPIEYQNWKKALSSLNEEENIVFKVLTVEYITY